MVINISVNGGLLPGIILLTQGRWASPRHYTVDPRTTCPANSVLFLANSPIKLIFFNKSHDHQPFPRTLANKNYRCW